jgi:hypothetical protein
VLADAGGHTAELVVLVVRHHASSWVREIARNDDDHDLDATFDPETGVVTVYEGRREFKALEKAARRAGLLKTRIREYGVPSTVDTLRCVGLCVTPRRPARARRPS